MHPFHRCMKRQNDVVFSHAALDEFVANLEVGVVLIDPNFAVFDVKMQRDGIDELAIVLPTDGQKLIMIALARGRR